MSTDLATRVYHAILLGDSHGELFAVALEHGDCDEGTVPDRDCNLAHFGLVVGVAYAIARTEDPFEHVDSVIERASVAAREAWNRWTSVPAQAAN